MTYFRFILTTVQHHLFTICLAFLLFVTIHPTHYPFITVVVLGVPPPLSRKRKAQVIREKVKSSLPCLVLHTNSLKRFTDTEYFKCIYMQGRIEERVKTPRAVATQVFAWFEASAVLLLLQNCVS